MSKVNRETCNHHWVVFSTALAEGSLMLTCATCGLCAVVRDPSKEEWRKAYDAPENPYRWDGDLVRVEVLPKDMQPDGMTIVGVK